MFSDRTIRPTSDIEQCFFAYGAPLATKTGAITSVCFLRALTTQQKPLLGNSRSSMQHKVKCQLPPPPRSTRPRVQKSASPTVMVFKIDWGTSGASGGLEFHELLVFYCSRTPRFHMTSQVIADRLGQCLHRLSRRPGNWW